jgi:hypothetical protein
MRIEMFGREVEELAIHSLCTAADGEYNARTCVRVQRQDS